MQRCLVMHRRAEHRFALIPAPGGSYSRFNVGSWTPHVNMHVFYSCDLGFCGSLEQSGF